MACLGHIHNLRCMCTRELCQELPGQTFQAQHVRGREVLDRCRANGAGLFQRSSGGMLLSVVLGTLVEHRAGGQEHQEQEEQHGSRDPFPTCVHTANIPGWRPLTDQVQGEQWSMENSL